MRRLFATGLLAAVLVACGVAPAFAVTPPTPRSAAAARVEARAVLNALGHQHWKKAYAHIVPAQQRDFTEHQLKACETRGSGFGYLRVISTGQVTRGKTHVYGYGDKTLDKAAVVYTAAIGPRAQRHYFAGTWPLVFHHGWKTYFTKKQVRELERC